MTVITDLSAFVEPARKVKLSGGGPTRKVPADAPVGWLLGFRELQAKTDSDEFDELDLIEAVRDSLVDLFRFEAPDQDEDRLVSELDKFGTRRLLGLVSEIYSDAEEPPAEDEAPPPKAGTRNTSRARRRNGSGSSS